MDSVAAQLEFPIDFAGQAKVNSIISKCLFFVVAPVSFLAGFVSGNLLYSVATFVASIAVVLVAVLPSWPAYNKNPVKWLEVKYDL